MLSHDGNGGIRAGLKPLDAGLAASAPPCLVLTPPLPFKTLRPYKGRFFAVRVA